MDTVEWILWILNFKYITISISVTICFTWIHVLLTISFQTEHPINIQTSIAHKVKKLIELLQYIDRRQLESVM